MPRVPVIRGVAILPIWRTWCHGHVWGEGGSWGKVRGRGWGRGGWGAGEAFVRKRNLTKYRTVWRIKKIYMYIKYAKTAMKIKLIFVCLKTELIDSKTILTSK